MARLRCQGAVMYVETAEDVGGEPFYIDHGGRIGVETDDGLITWFVVAGVRFLAVEKTQPTEDMDALQATRLYGTQGSEPWTGRRA